MVTRIGVNTATSVQAARGTVGVPSGRYQIAGVTDQGPAGSRVVRSLSEYAGTYGGRRAHTAHMYDAAALFFAEGGSELVVTRVVGPAAVADAVTLKDRAASPADTLSVTDVTKGGRYLQVVVEDAGEAGFTLTITDNGVPVESWQGLTTPAQAVAAAEGSQWVTVRSLGAATTGEAARPAVGTFDLDGGSDDRAGVTAPVIAAAVRDGGDLAAGGALAAPGFDAAALMDNLPAVARERRQIVLLAAPATADAAAAAALGASLRSPSVDADRVGLFYPWVTVQDGSSRRAVDPVSYVAAARSRAHVAGGYWSVPAGEGSRSVSLVGTSQPLDVAGNDTLAASNVNGLVTLAGAIRVYGWQSLSTSTTTGGLLSIRDTLNGVELAAARVLEPYVFSHIDGRGHLQARVTADVEGVLAPLAEAGALYARRGVDGEVLDPGYQVTVDTPVEVLSRNELRVLIAVRLSPLAQLVQVEIVRVPLSAAL